MKAEFKNEHVEAAYAARDAIMESPGIEFMDDALVSVALLSALAVTCMADTDADRVALIWRLATATKNALIFCEEEKEST